jgi:hypothetical protein
MLTKIMHRINHYFLRKRNQDRFNKAITDKLPSNLHELMAFSYKKKLDGINLKLGDKVEQLRASIVENNFGKKVKTFGSPHSNTELFDINGRVIPGGFNDRDIKGVARTGTNAFGGIQLKKILDAFGPGTVIELGTNTGLSGCYFLSSKNVKELITIEGSPDLCQIAQSNLIQFGSNFKIINCLFDDAITQMEAEGRRFQYAFIDGQHEKKATIHYMERLIPLLTEGAVLIFDDIYWSEDMNDAWIQIKGDPRFDLCIDFGWRGICRLSAKSMNIHERLFFDLTEYHGRPLIQRPGW